MSEKLSSTKDLKRVLGKKELMGIAIGSIIGSGIMVQMGTGIALTGRSANIAFLVSTFFTICNLIPMIFVSSCLRFRGGDYTQMGLFAGDKFAGAYTIVYIFKNITIAMFALSFADYFLSLFPGLPHMAVAIGVATIFFILNFFGVNIMAKVQNLMVGVLLFALLLFVLFGMPHVDFSTYFSNADGNFMTDGVPGILSAAATLGFATGGANMIFSLSAECKNPKKDIPFVLIASTLSVAVLYGLIATVASGVLPVDQVAGKSLTVVAAEIFPRPLYLFFIVGGALFAISTTLNSKLGSVTKPLMQMCEDGWFPKSLADLHPKYRTPWKLQLLFYVVTIIPIVTGFKINQITTIVLIIGYCITALNTVMCFKLPKMFPEAWKKSNFHMPMMAFSALLLLSLGVTVVQFYSKMRATTIKIVILNAVTIAIAFLFANWRLKTGKAKPTISYEVEDEKTE
ncbi:MAG: APC family permease [Clostridiaceae bacterium]|nr:APC family permease [Clostridiaceae bacterium]